MKLLLDQGIPRSAAGHLRAGGVDAVHTGEIGMATATDEDILDRARTEARLVVTLDADFHKLMALTNAAKPSVIRIRIEGLGGRAMADLIVKVIGQCSADLQQGVLVSVQPTGLRLRKLPLTP